MPRDRGEFCYTCKAVKESRFAPYCRSCKRKKDNEWRLSTGRTIKHRTGKCPCGQERASYHHSYCIECVAKYSKEYRKTYQYSPEQIARRNELQRKRYHERKPPKELKIDPINEKRRQRYHDMSPEAIKDRIRHRVRALTRSYIKAGKLIKGLCEFCGDMKVEAHHDDYEKPMDIRWLCKNHHVEHHKKFG